MASDKTKWIFEADTPAQGSSKDFTETFGKTDVNLGGPSPYDATRLVDNSDDRTRLELAEDLEVDSEIDPVVGWLVVVRGPGLGRCISIGAGMNILGRSADVRVPLDFGDQTISNDDHLRIIYDDSNRTFLVAPGTGKNITRLNGQVVTSTLGLPDRSIIELSKKTAVRFVAFCDQGFDWSDLAKPQG